MNLALVVEKGHCRHVFTLRNYFQSCFTTQKFPIFRHASRNLSERKFVDSVI